MREAGPRGAIRTGRDAFPLAPRYPGAVAVGTAAHVREPPPASFPAPPSSERHLQCVWYDAALRPARLRTRDGEEVDVVSPGRWNLGPGPDFTEAAVRVGPARREVRGDVEVHLRPADWTAHGHAGDPRYARVRLHVTFAPGPPPSAPLPPGVLSIALRDALAANRSFDFNAIDPAAYPYAVRSGACPCSAVLDAWTPSARTALLDAAGQERLRRKAERLAARAREKGVEQAFYEEMMSTLGYRHNKGPFRCLAESVPLDALRDESGGSPRAAYALLSGVAGLLPAAPRPGWDAETLAEFRATWDAWWKRRSRWEGVALPADAWRNDGVRPANRPVRRLQAAARWFTRDPPLIEALRAGAREDPVALLRHAPLLLDAPPDGYWGRRLTWGGTVRARPQALVGRARAAAVVLNVVAPMLALAEPDAAATPGWLDALPAESDHALLRQTAHALFGPHHPASWYRTGLRRQGLLQIFHDYCLTDRSGCTECPLPAQLDDDRRPSNRPP